MTIKLNWKNGLGFAVVVIAATYIGYLISQPEYCCIHPIAQGQNWIEYLAAFAGPIALAIPFVANRLTKRREQETRRKQLQEFQSNATKALVTELDQIIAQVEAIHSQCQRVIKDPKNHELGSPIYELPPRAFFMGLQPRLAELPQHVVTTISLLDHLCGEHYHRLMVETRKEQLDLSKILTACKSTALGYAEYVAYLIEIGNEAPKNMHELQEFRNKVKTFTNHP
jgi:hypothetical protein